MISRFVLEKIYFEILEAASSRVLENPPLRDGRIAVSQFIGAFFILPFHYIPLNQPAALAFFRFVLGINRFVALRVANVFYY